ncbi:MAG: helix-turn-helix transcriptional regulator [Clostridia bacterium]|nr:helix-turn-helix transcriptional regulator [Clostridia bacterium]
MQNERVRRNLAEIHAFISLTEDIGHTEKLCDIHYHDEVELLLLTGGKLSCYLDGGCVTASTGQVIFVDSRVPHWTAAETADCSYILLQFIPDDFEPGSRGGRSAVRSLYRFARKGTESARLIEDPAVAAAIRSAWEEYAAKREGAGKFILSHLYYLMGWLERSGSLSASVLPDDQAIQKLLPALEYIDSHYGMQELSLETASDVLGLNPAYFCRLFKRATGHGFTEYLNFVRVTKSEELLQNTSLSILDISLEVGFSSVSYYNRIFKRMKNCTPSVYRSAQYSAM